MKISSKESRGCIKFFVLFFKHVNSILHVFTYSLTWTLAVALVQSLITLTEKPLLPLVAEGMDTRVTV